MGRQLFAYDTDTNTIIISTTKTLDDVGGGTTNTDQADLSSATPACVVFAETSVGAGGQTNFPIVTINENQRVEVRINGEKYQEGADANDKAWHKDISNALVVLHETISEDAEVEIYIELAPGTAGQAISPTEVGVGGAALFSSAVKFKAATYMELYVNGQEYREGGDANSNAWHRDVGTQNAILHETAPEGAWVQLIVYPCGNGQVATSPENFTHTTFPSEVTLTTDINDDQRIDVLINGGKYKEGVDANDGAWHRDAVNNKIIFHEALQDGEYWIRVKIFAG